jgi:hypothetical protein
MFRWRQQERKLDVFFPAKKAQDVHRAVHHRPANILGFFGGKKTSSFLSIPLPPTKHDTH